MFSRLNHIPEIPKLKPSKHKKEQPKLKTRFKKERKLLPQLKPKKKIR